MKLGWGYRQRKQCYKKNKMGGGGQVFSQSMPPPSANSFSLGEERGHLQGDAHKERQSLWTPWASFHVRLECSPPEDGGGGGILLGALAGRAAQPCPLLQSQLCLRRSQALPLQAYLPEAR